MRWPPKHLVLPLVVAAVALLIVVLKFQATREELPRRAVESPREIANTVSDVGDSSLPETTTTTAPESAAVSHAPGRVVAGHSEPWRQRVVVKSASGQPVAGAEVWLVPLDGSVPEDIQARQLRQAAVVLATDESGSAGVSFEVRTPYLVHLHQNGLEWVDDQWDPRASASMVLKAAAAKRLTGHVVDSSKQPVGHAVARRRRWAQGNEQGLYERLLVDAIEEEVACDAQGRFEFHMVDDREQRVEVSAEGYVGTYLGAVQPEDHLTVVLSRPATLSGRVTDDAGHGLAGVEVRVVVTGIFPESFARILNADQQGRFEVADGPSGQVAVGFHKEGFASDRIELTVEPGGRADASLSLQRATSITGSVVGADGVPIAGIAIDVVDELNGIIVDRFFTRATGAFEITRVATGRPYLLTVNGTRANMELRAYGVLGGTKDLVLTVDRIAIMNGAVTFDGEPAKEFTIRQISLTRNLIDVAERQTYGRPVPIEIDKGTYHWLARPGAIDLEARADGYAPVWIRGLNVPISSGTIRVDFHFTSGVTLAARVVDAVSGDPIANATITAMERCYSGNAIAGFGAQEWVTDASGMAALELMSLSLDAIRVSAQGYGMVLVRQPLESAIGSPPQLNVMLSPGGSIAGTVDVPYVAPETAVTLHARPLGFERAISSAVNADGSYRIDGLPAGPVEVELQDLFYSQRFMSVALPARQVVVRAGEVVRLDWTGMAGTLIKGEVKGYDGVAVIHAFALDAEHQPAGLAGGAHTDLEHRFRIPGIRAGSYLLVGRSGEPGRTLRASQILEVQPGDPERVVVFDVSNDRVQGTVVDDTGNLISHATVTMRRESPDSRVADAVVTTTLEGSFEVTGMGEDSYVAIVERCRYGTISVPGVRSPSNLGKVVLSPEATLRVRVEDDRQEPIQDATVVLQGPARSVDPQTSLTHVDGSCHFAGLGRGNWMVTASLPRHQPAMGRVVVEPKERRELTIVLVRYGALQVHLLGVDRKPITQAAIKVLMEDGEELQRAQPIVTDTDGNALVLDLPPGVYSVAHEALDLVADVTVLPGETADVLLKPSDADSAGGRKR